MKTAKNHSEAGPSRASASLRQTTPLDKQQTSSFTRRSPFSGTPEWAQKGTSRKDVISNGEHSWFQDNASKQSPAPAVLAGNNSNNAITNSRSSASRSASVDSTDDSEEARATLLKSFFKPPANKLDEIQANGVSNGIKQLEKATFLLNSSKRIPPPGGVPRKPHGKIQANEVHDEVIQVKPAKARQRSPVLDRSLSFRPASTTPHPSSQIEIRIPPAPPDPDVKRRRRRELLRALERSADPIKDNLDEIQQLFGLNGFNPKIYNISDDEKQLKKLAGRRRRSVKRKKVTLDLGLQHLSIHDHHGHADLVHPKAQSDRILSRCFDDQKSPSRLYPPVTFLNTVNDNQLSGKFQFISDYIFRKDVVPLPSHTNRGCDCNGACHPDTCGCLTKTFKDPDPNNPEKKIERRCQTQTYDHTAMAGDSRLSDIYIQRHLRKYDLRKTEITECNDLCGCGPDCWNRVVQKGRTLPFEIFQTTKDKGFGVRCPTSAIRKGQFLERYLGEVITATEQEDREQATNDRDAAYVFSLDWWNETNLNNYAYHQIDGEFFGSAMRFANHSCDPNSRSFPVQTRHQGDRRVYDLAFFAIRDIKMGEEITIDYHPQLAKGDPEDEDEQQQASAMRPFGNDHGANVGIDDHDEQLQDKREDPGDIDKDEILPEGTVLCRCGAKNCRRRLWPLSSLRKKRARRVNR